MRPQWGLSACRARLTLLVSILNPMVGSWFLENLNDLVLGFTNMVTQLFGMCQPEERSLRVHGAHTTKTGRDNLPDRL